MARHSPAIDGKLQMELAGLGEAAQGVEWREHQAEETEITHENFIICGFFGDIILRSVERARA